MLVNSHNKSTLLEIFELISKSLLLIMILLNILGFFRNTRLACKEYDYKAQNAVHFSVIAYSSALVSYMFSVELRYVQLHRKVANILIQLALCINFCNTLLYSTFYLYDRKLILRPEELIADHGRSNTQILSSTVFPLCLLLIEQMDEYPFKTQWIKWILSCISVWYYALLKIQFHRLGSYVYPFLDQLSEMERILFFIIATCSIIAWHKLYLYIRKVLRYKPYEREEEY